MDTLQLEAFVQTDKYASKYFCGVWSADHLKQFEFPPHRKAVLIVNLSARGIRGTHWVSIAWLPKKKIILYMDSLGIDPRIFKEISQFILRHTEGLYKRCHLLTNAIQYRNARTCGLYCILWVFQFSRGWTLKRFASLFSQNRLNNERIIQKWSYFLKQKGFSLDHQNSSSRNSPSTI